MEATLVGVDTGGTFTDFVLIREGQLVRYKVLSTPEHPAQAILQGLDELGVRTTVTALVHGSTVATNAVLEGRGAVTGLITTAGFRDVLEIGRQTRPQLYDLRVQRPAPLVPRSRRVEVAERLDERGKILTPLDPDDIQAALATLLAAGAESVAIVLLFSFANPAHELAIARAARAAGLYVSASAEILPEFREYERTSTVVLNAYVGPLIDRYLADLEAHLPTTTALRIMQSNGGSITSATARGEAARTLLSGPAGGVVGAAFCARLAGWDHLVTLDIGGTSTDVALVQGAIAETTDGEIGGYPLKLPMLDIHTVGAGGGSLAWLDPGGALRVGPRSAGANPGPAAYGRGGQAATVTDAHVVLGRLPTDALLGGAMTLDALAAQAAVTHLADQLGTSVEVAALGMLQVVNANMVAALRVISVQRGIDPRPFTLVAFGGAGPLHACELAEELGMARVLVPAAPGVLSALGMLVADIRKDYVRTIMQPATIAAALADEVLAELTALGMAELHAEGLADEHIIIEPALDLRYGGQSYELVVPYSGDLEQPVAAFHLAHATRFGYSQPNEAVTVVNVRVTARGLTPPPPLAAGAREDPSAEPLQRPVVFAVDGAPQTFMAPIVARASLALGQRLVGPTIITQYDTTTVLPPRWVATVDSAGNLVATLGQEA